MANVNNPHGLRPIGTIHGGGFEVEEFSKVVGYGTAIFIFDAVNRVADNSIEASATPGTTRYSGVALNFGAASTATTHLVITDPLCLFEAQDNNSTDGIAAADLGLNANLVLTAGDTTNQQSKHQIDEATAAVTATLDVKLRRLFNVPDNAHGANARIEIQFNKHRMTAEVAGV
jgi:BioD-like phosphotransacetylase family protein